MSYEKFVPEVFSQTILKELRAKTIWARGCHNEFKGKITEAGDKITFRSLGDPTVHTVDYADRNADIAEPEMLDTGSLTMEIRQIRTINFLVGDIDAAIAEGNLLALGRENVPMVLADDMDRYIAKLGTVALSDSSSPLFYSTPMAIARGESSSTQKNPLDLIDDLVEALSDNNVPQSAKLEIIVPPKFYKIMKQEYRELDTDNSEMMSTGRVGRYNRVAVVQSTNCYKPATGQYHLCIRTPRFIGLADALSKVEAYRPEKKFADAIKALHLYDAKVIRPKEGFFVPISMGTAENAENAAE